MPGVTPLYALPYPLAGDTISSLDETLRALTTRLELVLAAASQPPLTPSDFSALSAQVTAFGAGPTAVATPFAAATGWGIGGTLWQWQRVRICNMTIVNNTGAAIACSATTGLVTGPPTVATIAAGHRPVVALTAPHTANAGTSRVNTTGAVALMTYVPGVAFPISGSISLGAVWLVP